MRKIYLLHLFLAILLASCAEKEDGPEIIPDDVLFVKAKIDGQDYEYSYKLKENYIGESGPEFGLNFPGKGQNTISLYGEVLSIDIQYGCNLQPGKNACVYLIFQSLTSIGKNTDPFFSGIISGDVPKFMFRNYSYYANGDPLPFEVNFRKYDPIKFTIEGTFKGKADMIYGTTIESKVVEIEGSFKSGARIE